MRVVGVFARRDQREVRRAERAELLEDELGVRLQLVFAHTRRGVAHRFHDAEAGNAGRLANHRNLARALHGAQGVEDRIEILDLRLRRGRRQLGEEGRFPRVASVPGILLHRARTLAQGLTLVPSIPRASPSASVIASSTAT